MQQLIEQLTTQYKISEDDAIGIVNVIATYAEEKSPGLGNSLVSIINGTDESTVEETSAPTSSAVTNETAEKKEDSLFEKAKDFVEGRIPDGLKGKAEEVIGEMGGKLKGFFN